MSVLPGTRSVGRAMVGPLAWSRAGLSVLVVTVVVAVPCLLAVLAPWWVRALATLAGMAAWAVHANRPAGRSLARSVLDLAARVVLDALTRALAWLLAVAITTVVAAVVVAAGWHWLAPHLADLATTAVRALAHAIADALSHHLADDVPAQAAHAAQTGLTGVAGLWQQLTSGGTR